MAAPIAASHGNTAGNNIILSVVESAGVEEGAQDSFTWQVSANQINIRGASPRCLLFGVYHFLEALGCRWLAPGELWTRIPTLTAIALPSEIVSEKPAFMGRCLILGHYAFIIFNYLIVILDVFSRMYEEMLFKTTKNAPYAQGDWSRLMTAVALSDFVLAFVSYYG